MAQDILFDRIKTVAEDNIGILAALLDARAKLGDQVITQFLDKVSEKGEALWLRFRVYRKERGDWMGFGHFIASIVTSNAPKF